MMWLKSLKAVTWLASISLVASALFLAYIVLFPVDVITNWKLTIPEGNFYLGQRVLIESAYTKRYAVGGESQRYIECRNKNGIYVRYLLSEAKANRAKASSTGTGIPVRIPDDIVEVMIPTKCFFSISIEYDAAPRRTEPEYNRTRDFVLYKNQEQAKESKPISQSVLSPATTAPTTSIAQTQTDNPQQTTNPQPAARGTTPTRPTTPSTPARPVEPEEPRLIDVNVLGLEIKL